jgi:hypothetical protein
MIGTFNADVVRQDKPVLRVAMRVINSDIFIPNMSIRNALCIPPNKTNIHRCTNMYYTVFGFLTFSLFPVSQVSDGLNNLLI